LLLRWILFALIVVGILRLARRLLERPGRTKRRLDPEHAVRASWSEVRDDDGEGSAPR